MVYVCDLTSKSSSFLSHGNITDRVGKSLFFFAIIGYAVQGMLRSKRQACNVRGGRVKKKYYPTELVSIMGAVDVRDLSW